jgi:A nuclease family of the HNH/ENDO VII superfamily with conserved AHH
VAGPKPAAPKAPTLHKHHIATDKNSVSDVRGGPWTPEFEKIFKQAGMSLDDPANIVEVAGHQGPHPEAYHRLVHERLRSAVGTLSGDAAKQALIAQLNVIRADILKPGSVLNKLVTGN